MMRWYLMIVVMACIMILSGCSKQAINQSETLDYQPARVDYGVYEMLVDEVKSHRADRIVSFDEFLELAQQSGVIILDARSRELFDSSHISGAINLPFTEFTKANLERLIPSKDTKILIYCNNNIDGDEINFATKSAPVLDTASDERILLALNVPTYINLYGYGYREIYELGELVSIRDDRLQLVGDE